MIDRRTVLRGLAGGVAALPVGARSQYSSGPFVIGYITLTTPEWHVPYRKAFDDSLRERGYVEGGNIVVHRRYGRGDARALPALVSELLALRPHLVVACNNPEIDACRRATGTVPIVMAKADDPIGAGFIRSLARPGGNITGLSTYVGAEIQAKKLELLKEIVPTIRRIGVLRVVRERTADHSAALDGAARTLGMTLDVVEASGADDFARALPILLERRPDGLLVDAGPSSVLAMQRICDFALKNRLPAIYTVREFAEAGLLITFGVNLKDNYRRAAIHVDKILKGARPGDLPVEQPTRFDLVVNLRTAKAIGVKIPQSVLLRADEIIE